MATLTVQAGAGIVADSDPETEDHECAHKAAALLAAVTAARAMQAGRPTPPQRVPRPSAPAHHEPAGAS